MKKSIYFLFIFAFQFTFSQSADILLNGTVSAENNQIKNVSTPTDSNDAVNKSYVDSNISELSDNNQSISNNSIGLTGALSNNYDGNRYRTITMCDGNQWTIDYLRTTHFNNGDEIPLIQDAAEWSAQTSAAKSYYSGVGNPYNTGGFIYNWFVIEDERGIAPEGWRVATVEDWNSIIECLGGEEIAGGKMKYVNQFDYQLEIDLYNQWCVQQQNVGSSIFGEATNSSGLSLKASGFREGANGNFYNSYEQVIIWADSEEAPSRVEVFCNSAGVLTGTTDPYDGYYVLLVKE